jgi:hypothetical protein
MNSFMKATVLAGLFCAVVPTAFAASNQDTQTRQSGMQTGGQNGTGSASDMNSGNMGKKDSATTNGPTGSTTPNDPVTNESSSDSGGTKNDAPEPGRQSN